MLPRVADPSAANAPEIAISEIAANGVLSMPISTET
jgi:hypothetical protein